MQARGTSANRFGGNRDSLKQIAPSELHQVKLKRQAAYGDVLMAFLSDAGSTPATSTILVLCPFTSVESLRQVLPRHEIVPHVVFHRLLERCERPGIARLTQPTDVRLSEILVMAAD